MSKQPSHLSTFQERVESASTPRDLLGLSEEALQTNLNTIGPLGRGYNAALAVGDREGSLRFDRQIRESSATMLKRAAGVRERLLELYPTIEAAAAAGESLAEEEERKGFMSFWTSSNEERDQVQGE